MKQNRAILLIDGSNFYFKLKDLKISDQLQFNFSGFAKHLSQDFKIVDQCYYIGRIRTGSSKKSKTMHANQQKLLAHLHDHGFRYSLGYLLKSDSRYHEKGVDVQMAVDILKGAYKDMYDHALLISSDTDLIPAIVEAQEEGKTIEYMGFYHNPSYALLKSCKQSRLLTRDDLLPFTK